jgi:hypothetical protein
MCELTSLTQGDEQTSADKVAKSISTLGIELDVLPRSDGLLQAELEVVATDEQSREIMRLVAILNECDGTDAHAISACEGLAHVLTRHPGRKSILISQCALIPLIKVSVGQSAFKACTSITTCLANIVVCYLLPRF